MKPEVYHLYQAITDFQSFVDMMNQELLAAKHSRQYQATYDKFKRRLVTVKLSGFAELKLHPVQILKKAAHGKERTVETFEGVMEINEVALKTAGRLDGFWLLLTNHTEKDDGAPNCLPGTSLPRTEKRSSSNPPSGTSNPSSRSPR